MQTLIIILIVVLIAQTCIFIYSNFIDLSNKRNAADTQKMITDAQNCYLTDKARLQQCIDNRDRDIHEWAKKYNDLVGKFNALGAEYEKLKKTIDIEDEQHKQPYLTAEQEDDIMELAADIIDRGPDFNEEEVYEREVAFEHNAKEYNAVLTIELTKDLNEGEGDQ